MLEDARLISFCCTEARAVELAARRVGQLLHQDSRLNVQHQYTLGIGQMLNSLLTDVQVEFVALVHSLDTMMDPSAFLLLTGILFCLPVFYWSVHFDEYHDTLVQ